MSSNRLYINGLCVGMFESFKLESSADDLVRHLVPQGPKPAKAFRVWRSSSKKAKR